jgi:glycosyltransferase involved in cell wall biosynthesis
MKRDIDKNSPLLSVIVPVYNVEKYLECCIKSILNQTYKNIEVLLIDDGSTDDSGMICERWALRDERIKVFHKPNGGLSSARNYGLNRVNGELIGFVDSDDYILPSMYEELISLLSEYGCSVSLCAYNVQYDNMRRAVSLDLDKKKTCIEGRYVLDSMVFGKPYKFTYSVWKFLYKSEAINNIRFDEGKLYEDTTFDLQVLKDIKKVAITFNPLYVYRMRKDSIMNLKLEKRNILDLIQYERAYYNYYLIEREDNIFKKAQIGIVGEMLTYGIIVLKEHSKEKFEIISLIKEIIVGFEVKPIESISNPKVFLKWTYFLIGYRLTKIFGL